jgi:CRP/FNR family transcriptional regulator, cyclic AMP receptor protein
VEGHNRGVLGPWPAGDEAIDFLSLLSDVNRRRVLEGSTKAAYTAGSIAFHPEGPERPFVLDRGLARVYTSVPDGRQATVTFVHTNELAGGTAIVSHPPRVHIQVVINSMLTILDLDKVRRLAATEADVCQAVAVHLAARVRSGFRLISVRSLGNIRERVAYDLLDRACQSQLEVGRLEVDATHADLADSIGSSREVVSRALRDLRAAGIVETAPGRVRVTDPVRLAAIVRGFVI